MEATRRLFSGLGGRGRQLRRIGLMCLVMLFVAGGFLSNTVHANAPSAMALQMLPAAPTNLQVSAVTADSITLSWESGGGTVDGYRIHLWNGSGWQLLTNVPGIQTSYTDTGLPCASNRYYFVNAFNSVGESLGTPWVQGTTSACVQTVPAAPTNLQVSAVTADSITLSWQAGGGPVIGYRIYRWNGSGWQVLTNVSAAQTSYTDTGLPCANSRYYYVSAFNSGGESTGTPWVQGTTSACVQTTPGTPTNLQVSAVTADSITLSWESGSGTVDGYRIYRWTGSSWQALSDVPNNQTSYTDTGLPCENNRYYFVSAFNGVGESPGTSWVRGTTSACVQTVPPTPTVVSVSATANSITLLLRAASSNTEGFRIFKPDGSTVTVPVTADGTASYSDTGLHCGTAYSYTVSAYNSAGESAQTPAAEGTTGACTGGSITERIGTCLSAEEARLVQLINDYRAANGLPPVPATRSLAAVAQWHVFDLETNRPHVGTVDSRGLSCNMHSWSDKGNGLWTPLCYTSDHAYAQGVWSKPREITKGVYTGNGFENSHGGQGGYVATADNALAGWRGSAGHNALILEQGIWAGSHWPAMGVGIYGGYAVLWFGDSTDPQGTIAQCTQ